MFQLPRFAKLKWLRFLKFLLVGALNTTVGYGLFAIFLIAGVDPAKALAIATVLGVLFNFKSFGKLVFGESGMCFLPRFIIFYLTQYLVNLGALRQILALGFTPLEAQLIILPPLSLVSFFAMRRLIFEASVEPDNL